MRSAQFLIAIKKRVIRSDEKNRLAKWISVKIQDTRITEAKATQISPTTDIYT